jgi:hypothetical protein
MEKEIEGGELKVISLTYIMRTLVDIPDTQLAQLTAIGQAKKVPRAEVIREAIAAYIETQPNPARDAAFGIWQGEEDGLEYQRRIRDEW